jgi:hypothetical protein
VVVYRYDRFARSLLQLVNALEEFRTLGIDFISLHEGVDTSTPNGRLVFGIFGSIAEFERELIRDRVRTQGRTWTAIATEMGIGETRLESLKARTEFRGLEKTIRGFSKVLDSGGPYVRDQGAVLPLTPITPNHVLRSSFATDSKLDRFR